MYLAKLQGCDAVGAGLSWDDFRLVKAIADRGGLTSAARHLGINHSTAFRRLGALETALAARLFERSRLGYVPTPAGRAMAATASRMEMDIADFDRDLASRAQTPSGELRVTAPTGFVIDLLMPLLARFLDLYPQIQLDIVVSEDPLNLSRRDADVAIRASDAPPANLIGRRLSGIAWAIYARGDADREKRRWISPSLRVGRDSRFFRRIRELAGDDAIVMQIDAVIGLREAIEAGVGIGPLPCYVGDACATLRRLSEPEPDLASDLWILTHPDLRHAVRVRAFTEFMAEAVAPLRAAFEGRSGAIS